MARSVYLEDLYVKPDARGGGIGTELIRAIAQTAQDRNCARFQWQVIDWNDPAIGALSLSHTDTALSSDHRRGDPRSRPAGNGALTPHHVPCLVCPHCAGSRRLLQGEARGARAT
jgi:GNAT superfamily N-acetyltransferase|eukprot:COSAG06_NODE_572_length_14089_cov_360.675625_4_plen_115_part_00